MVFWQTGSAKTALAALLSSPAFVLALAAIPSPSPGGDAPAGAPASIAEKIVGWLHAQGKKVLWAPDKHLGDYVQRVTDSFLKNGLFEREIAGRREEFGPIVHVFSTYESRRSASDANPIARGINSIQLMKHAGRWWVVIRKDGRYRNQTVRLGPQHAGWTAITEGIKAGDHVVIAQAYRIYHRDFARNYQPPD